MNMTRKEFMATSTAFAVRKKRKKGQTRLPQ